ncbi:MAG TPA: hypothetical protein VHK27_05450 [Gammaproteobacteria bacterium]|nr:hypothetical protein [Gammaproteobacteria bacterium]
MEVEAHVWYWTPNGMSERYSASGGKTGYIEAREVERLLEQAHEKGKQEVLRKLEVEQFRFTKL